MIIGRFKNFVSTNHQGKNANGIKWNIYISNKLPLSGNEGDVYIISPNVPQNNNIKNVVLNNQLNISNDIITIYQNNSANIFLSDTTSDNTDNVVLFDFSNGFIYDVNLIHKSVVNINNSQFQSDVYLWDIKQNSWFKCDYVALPKMYSDKLSLSNLFNCKINYNNYFSLFNVIDNAKVGADVSQKYSDKLSLQSFLISKNLTIMDLFKQLDIVDIYQNLN